MDFRFDQAERGLLADARAAIRRSFDLGRFRGEGSAVERWRTLAADDWLHASLSQESGGAGLPLAVQAGIAREAGAVLLVDNWVDNAYVIPYLLARARPRDRVPELLERHRAMPGFLLADGRGERWLGPPSTGLSSWCFGVIPDADVYWVDQDGSEDATLVRVTKAMIEFTSDPGITLDAGRVVVSGGVAERIELRLNDASRVELGRAARTLHSSALVGVAEEALDQTVEYAKLRVQYGKPIGQFQALKHMLADVRVANEIGGNAAYYAALCGDSDPWVVSAARLQAVDAALGATRTMMQVFGGMGFTWESDVHLFLKTALNGAVRFGLTDADALALGEHVLELA